MEFPLIRNKWDLFPAKTLASGKEGTTVYEHCVCAGVMAQCLYDLFPDRIKKIFPSRELIGLIVAGHDIGKISPYYLTKYYLATDFVQNWLPDLARRKWAEIEHGEAGSIFHGGYTIQGTVAESHHGFKNRTALNREPVQENLGGMDFHLNRKDLVRHLEIYFQADYTKATELSKHLESLVEKLICGITSVSDWLVSDENNFPPAVKIDLDYHRLQDDCRNILTKTGFFNLPVRSDLDFSDVFGGKTPFKSQQEFFDNINEPGLYILEAPMGGGKTEAALYAAYKLMSKGFHNGFYFALPTRLTSDKIHERVEAFLDKVLQPTQSIRKAKLAHGLSWLSEFGDDIGKDSEEGEKDKISAWFRPSKRALLYNYSVGTIDQALMSVTNSKYNFVRTFGLCGKVVILDEVHTYDMYTGTLMDNLIKKLLSLKCTVIILSATLKNDKRKNLLGLNKDSFPQFDMAYPLMSIKPESLPVSFKTFQEDNHKKFVVRLEDWDTKDISEQAVEKMEDGKCVLVICNTVDKAIEVYSRIKSLACFGSDVGLLHSRFPFYRRQEIEHEWMQKLGKDAGLSRPKGCILVSTQIVEQSVDIDADWMISELAPVDMILQRMGRLWRHERAHRKGNPEIVIVAGNPDTSPSESDVLKALGNKSCKVYYPYVLYRTYQTLKNRGSIFLPRDIRALIEETYSDMVALPSLITKFRNEMRNTQMREVGFANKASSGNLPQYDDEQDPTRYSSLPTWGVLLTKDFQNLSPTKARLTLFEKDAEGHNIILEIDANDKLDYSKARLLHRQSFSLMLNFLTTQSNGFKTVCPSIEKYFYHTPCVLVAEGKRVYREDGGQTPKPLEYTDTKGLYKTMTDELFVKGMMPLDN